MNAMGHNVTNFIGVPERGSASAIAARRARRHGDGNDEAWPIWPRWRCRCRANTLPMMTGTGPFGPIEMGGMFTVVKVREGLAPGDYQRSGLVQASAWDGRL